MGEWINYGMECLAIKRNELLVYSMDRQTFRLSKRSQAKSKKKKKIHIIDFHIHKSKRCELINSDRK